MLPEWPTSLTLGPLLVLACLAAGTHAFTTFRTLQSAEKARAAAIRDLQGSEAMFRGLMAGASDAILVTDEHGRISFNNHQASSLFGYEHGELIGMAVDQLLPERLRAQHAGHRAGFMHAPRRRHHDQALGLYARRKDGSEFPADISLSPVETVEGRFVMVLVRDLTERLKAEEAIAHARVLERSDALKDEFLNIVSHELRAPISVLSGTISLLEYELDGPLSAPQRRDVARLRQSTDHLLMLVNELLDMSMLHAGRLTIVPRPLPVGDLVAGAIDFVQPLAGERRIAIRTEVEPDLSPLHADGQRIRQVLINLITNALKYSPEDSTVTVRVRPEADVLRWEVSDQGPGIPPAEQARIFEKFSRLAPSPSVEGVGLGLYICQALVVAHGGDIGVVSDGQAGSTFWFTLPYRGEHADATA